MTPLPKEINSLDYKQRDCRKREEKRGSRPSTQSISDQIINEQVYTYNISQARAIYQYARYNEPEFEGKKYSFLDVLGIMSGQYEQAASNYRDVLSDWYEWDKRAAMRDNNGVLPPGWSSTWADEIAAEQFGSPQ